MKREQIIIKKQITTITPDAEVRCPMVSWRGSVPQVAPFPWHHRFIYPLFCVFFFYQLSNVTGSDLERSNHSVKSPQPPPMSATVPETQSSLTERGAVHCLYLQGWPTSRTCAKMWWTVGTVSTLKVNIARWQGLLHILYQFFGETCSPLS